MLRLYSLAELRLAQGRQREALDAAMQVGRDRRAHGPLPRLLPVAHDRGPGRADARGLRPRARPGQRRARARRAHRRAALRIRARRVVGLARAGQPGRTQPARRGARSARTRRRGSRRSARWSTSAPRCAERTARSEAREPLQRGGRHGGPRAARVALAERARVELAATGARPRREALLERPGLPHPDRATDRRAGRRRPEQPRDRPGAVRHTEDRRVPPAQRLPQARHRQTARSLPKRCACRPPETASGSGPRSLRF